MLRRPRSRTVIALVALGVLAAVFLRANVAGISAVSGQLTALDWRPLLYGLLLSTVAVWNRGLLNQSAHRAVGLHPRSGEMVTAAAVGFSAQKIVKSGGLSGLAVFVHHGRRRGYDAGAVTGACVLVAAASFVALGALMVTTIAALAITGRMTGWWIVAGTGFAIYAVATIVLMVVVGRSRHIAERLWIRAHGFAGQFRRRPRPAPDTRCVDDLFAAVAEARRRPAEAARMIAHALVGKASGALMLLVAARSVGVTLSPTAAMIVYAAALGASLVAVVPGGFGVVEASTAALLVSGGAAAPSAALIVALFRVFDLWLPLLVGVVVARGQLRTPAQATVETPPVVVGPVPVAA